MPFLGAGCTQSAANFHLDVVSKRGLTLVSGCFVRSDSLLEPIKFKQLFRAKIAVLYSSELSLCFLR